MAELCREVGFEPLASSIRLQSLQPACLRFLMFALFFSAASHNRISFILRGSLWPCRTWRKSVRGLLDAPCTSTAHFRHTILPRVVIRGVCYLDAERILGSVDVGSKLLLRSPLPAISLAVSLSPRAFGHSSSRPPENADGRAFCVACVPSGGESMIRLLIPARLLSEAAWIEETVGHN